MLNMSKRDDSFDVTIAINGFVFEGRGRDDEGDWVTRKVVLTSRSELDSLLDEYLALPSDD